MWKYIYIFYHFKHRNDMGGWNWPCNNADKSYHHQNGMCKYKRKVSLQILRIGIELNVNDESESESEIIYSIDIHRIHLQIKLHNTITHTHTCKSVVIYGESTTSPKIEGRQPDSSAITGGTPSCHNNNYGRHLWQQKPPDRRPSPSAVGGK